MKNYLPVRLSHLLRHCAVGAIVRGPNMMMTIKDCRYWTDRHGETAGRMLSYVDRVRAALGIEQNLREPPIAKQVAKRGVDGVCVPAMVFPRWGQCPHCGLLHYLPLLDFDDQLPRCREPDAKICPRRPRLHQVDYVVVHQDGFMNDLPWHYLVHSNSRSDCRIDTHQNYLRIHANPDNPLKPRIVCERCRANIQFDRFDLVIKIVKMDIQPWLRESVSLVPAPRILPVNDVRIHISETQNALVIPPESRIRRGTVVDRLYTSTHKRRRLESCKTALQRKSALRTIAGEFRCEPAEVETAWKEIQKGYPLYGQAFNLTSGQLLEDEYQALTKAIPDLAEDEDFVTQHMTPQWQLWEHDISQDLIGRHMGFGIDRLIAVKRLKEIMVFKGFYRVGKSTIVQPDIVGESDWLPALELFGEGIFITLDMARLKQWERIPAVQARATLLQKRFENAPSRINDDLIKVTPRFLLLHAFSHLLIRQLECDGGYPAASLKERIYCRAGACQMAGILIYVAVPDIVGSLGGIIEMAKPQRFWALAMAALKRVQWCSLDPVCAEHEGQGMHLLNRAACHACLLIPETSCVYQNLLLDRVMVKGDPLHGIPSFFESE